MDVLDDMQELGLESDRESKDSLTATSESELVVIWRHSIIWYKIVVHAELFANLFFLDTTRTRAGSGLRGWPYGQELAVFRYTQMIAELPIQ